MPSGPRPPRSEALKPLPGTGLQADEIELGRVSGVFGVTGEVRLWLHNPSSDLLDEPRDVVLIAPDGRRFAAVVSARSGAGKRVLGAIEGVGDRDAAEALKEWVVAIPAAALPPPDEDEFYVWQLEGLTVFLGDREVGVVTTVHATPGGDLLEIETRLGPEFVPVNERSVVSIDVDAGRVVLAADALEGRT